MHVGGGGFCTKIGGRGHGVEGQEGSTTKIAVKGLEAEGWRKRGKKGASWSKLKVNLDMRPQPSGRISLKDGGTLLKAKPKQMP